MAATSAEASTSTLRGRPGRRLEATIGSPSAEEADAGSEVSIMGDASGLLSPLISDLRGRPRRRFVFSSVLAVPVG